MQDRARRWRNIGLSVALAAGLVSGAAASIFDNNIMIVAPSSVLAGNPIDGYVMGLEGPGLITGTDSLGKPLGPGVENSGELRTYFTYPTSEPMAGTCVTIRAKDEDESAVASVIVL